MGLAEAAYGQLREEIVRLRRAPGTVLSEDDLMRELGVGRTPLREAIKRLQLEHLVVIAPRSATRVSPVAVDDVRQVSEVRAVLEAEAARLAAKRVTPAWRAEAEALTEQLTRHDLTPKDLMLLDEQVHRLIWQGSGNPLLIGTLDSYFSLSVRIGYLVLGETPDYSRSILDEREMLATIAAGDGRSAGRQMRDHVRAFENEAIRTLTRLDASP